MDSEVLEYAWESGLDLSAIRFWMVLSVQSAHAHLRAYLRDNISHDFLRQFGSMQRSHDIYEKSNRNVIYIWFCSHDYCLGPSCGGLSAVRQKRLIY